MAKRSEKSPKPSEKPGPASGPDADVMTWMECVERLVAISRSYASGPERLRHAQALVEDYGESIGKPAGWRSDLKEAFAEDLRSDSPAGDSIIGWMTLRENWD